MSLSYQFSVGTIQVGSNDLGTVTSLNVSYDGDPQSFYAGDYRLPIAVELGNRSGQITTSTARFDSADTVLDNRYLNVTLGSGQNSGGLTGTINNCKVVSYNVNSAQADFSLSDWTLLITSQEAEQSVKGGSLPSWV